MCWGNIAILLILCEALGSTLKWGEGKERKEKFKGCLSRLSSWEYYTGFLKLVQRIFQDCLLSCQMIPLPIEGLFAQWGKANSSMGLKH